MKFMTSAEIRTAFINFFEKNKTKQHKRVDSSALIPANDPSLLFTNAGMVQFKDVFLGLDKRPYVRAVSSQKCLRVGGKHNDLDQVGFTKRHHTFFEMLGNFSFGDYFKEEAIHFAWEFLTKELKLPVDKLWVTVYHDDRESATIWQERINFPKERIVLCGEKDNFWSMGDTGPCGPCTEIFYDHGPDIAGGPPGSPDEDGDRFVEIWNIVFMQYNRAADQSLSNLPKPSVDTGMGLERISAVMQGTCDNFEIDLFQKIIKFIANIAPDKNLDNKAMRVMADHIRAAAFLIIDGIYPSNEGRGYVLRRIIRRAVRFGYKEGLDLPFFYKLLEPLIAEMGDAYPDLLQKKDIIITTIEREEKQFSETIKQGLRVLEKELADSKSKLISGKTAFTLYDTFGFPLDLTQDIALERECKLDLEGYNIAMEQQRNQSKKNQGFKDMGHGELKVSGATDFVGYESMQADTKITHIFVSGENVKSITAGQNAILVLDRTPCYAESGGQVGDIALLKSSSSEFKISDTQKQNKVFLHHGCLEKGSLHVGDEVHVTVDSSRNSIKLNHSATHLLHAALRIVLGEHVTQKGSLVEQKRLRFDFAHFSPVKPEQISEIEKIVNNFIASAVSSKTEILDQDVAKANGAMALFEEKYDDKVRVISFGDFSKELCGGIHVSNTAEIGCFKITAETGIASGVRRIEAVTGQAVLKLLNVAETKLLNISTQLKVLPQNIEKRLGQLLVEQVELKQKLQKSISSDNAINVDDVVKNATIVRNEIKLLLKVVDNVDMKSLRLILDKIKSKLINEKYIIIMISDTNSKKNPIVINFSAELESTNISAKDLLVLLTQKVGGSGGGNLVMAQGVVSDLSKIESQVLSILSK
ncbi:MAG: alanine--tRNA ligase [Pseudomonadota bacterium]|nr:alanine--tRNA ligase [Pseudomonadota bacterium]